MSDSIIDIFADHTPVPDERNDALKGELEVLRVQLQPMVASAPSKDTDMLYPDMEVWCRTWKTLTNSLTKLMTLARERKVHFELSDAERQHGQTGNQTYDRFQQRISEVKEAAAKQAEQAALTTHAAKQTKQPQQKKRRQTQAKADKEIVEEKDGDNEVEVRGDDAEEQERPLMRSIRVRGARKITIESTAVAAIPAQVVVPKKITPRMSATRRAVEPIEGINAIPCDRCVAQTCTCYRLKRRRVCMNCHRLKAACSLAGKGNEKSSSPPSPTPPPPNPSTSAATSGPTTTKAEPAPKATGEDKSADLPPQKQHPAPVPLGSQRMYVEIPVVVDRKRKVAVLEPESSDAEDEDAYMTGRLDGLNTFVSTLESTLGALKKEVTDIDRYMTQKRRRRRRLLQ
ncbi:hypothetical protein BD769DRAFT_1683054 [Suillus cothurnatus]|nr:hypothetical protein BD769DRAFT_1683054 [Suillus cothurnatus]